MGCLFLSSFGVPSMFRRYRPVENNCIISPDGGTRRMEMQDWVKGEKLEMIKNSIGAPKSYEQSFHQQKTPLTVPPTCMQHSWIEGMIGSQP
jgi:hypothetical protein